MNGYLVMLRCSVDDIPIFLTSSKDEAIEFAKQATEDAAENESDILGIDVSEACNVSVFEFAGGKLTTAEVVRDFTA